MGRKAWRLEPSQSGCRVRRGWGCLLTLFNPSHLACQGISGDWYLSIYPREPRGYFPRLLRPNIAVSYRNVTNVYFRAVAWDWNVFLDKRHRRPENLSDAERRELLAKTPTLEWSAALPATTDFKQRTELVPAPTTLKPGFYFIIASHDKEFSERENQITYADVWVSELALVVRPHNQRIEGFVLVAGSGEPVSGAEVMSWHLDDQGNRVPTSPAISTDTNGFFSFPSKEYRGSLLRVRAKIGDVQQMVADSLRKGR